MKTDEVRSKRIWSTSGCLSLVDKCEIFEPYREATELEVTS